MAKPRAVLKADSPAPDCDEFTRREAEDGPITGVGVRFEEVQVS